MFLEVSDSSILSFELCPPVWMEVRCQLAFGCQPLDDHPAPFFDIALFRAASFFLTLGFGLRLEGDEDGETETLIISLEKKRRHPSHIFSPL